MSDFRQLVVERLGMTLRKDQQSFTDDQILRRIESTRDAYRTVVERETQLEARFKKLSEIAGEEATQEALDATPSEDKMQLLRWLDPKSDNFLGSGMQAEEYMMKRNISQYNRNLASQMNDEQQRRTKLIIRLSVELQRIRSEDLHGTASLESAITDIIKGEPAKYFDQTIGWMTDRAELCGNLAPEDAAAYKRQQDERDVLWAPAIATCREFTDAFKPVPEDRPHYATWEEMLEKEPGMVCFTHDKDSSGRGEGHIWVKESDAHHWSTPALWNLMLFRGSPEWWAKAFAAGVRWRGPRRLDENGYWHREDGGKFPDDPEKFWGNNYHRIYNHRELSSWLYRQKEKSE